MLRIARTLGLAVVFHFAVPASMCLSNTPPVGNSIVPACISLVGSDGANAAALGAFTVFVRDLANNPVPGASVTVDLSNATDLRLCAVQLASGVVMDCPGGRATAITDGAGQVTMTLLGGSIGAGVATTLLNGGRIYANGVQIGSPTVSAYDLDGAAGVSANDLSAWLTDFGSGENFGRSDYDCSGSLGANDFSLWLTAFGSGTQTLSCAATCP